VGTSFRAQGLAAAHRVRASGYAIVLDTSVVQCLGFDGANLGQATVIAVH
jgi:hypothetical protein